MVFKLVLGILLSFFLNLAEADRPVDELVAVCASCHGVDGNSFSSAFPNLAGQGENYLLKQLKDIRRGERIIPTMAGLLDNFSDRELGTIAAYYGSKERQMGFAKARFVALGEAIYKSGIGRKKIASCSSCHSPAGRGNDLARFPALAGQWEEYTLAQLKAFQKGERKNDGDSQMMRGVVKDLTEIEMEAVASYIRGLR
ncbi:MAG: cytochrome c4 [Gammaproteobacteria bacterium]|nr:cytochrome c4 [Gammaproteobacteria bacterium]|tara:strand:+ start:130 stop:726 length:597 start_codon:yes stop_codon:yes gene_type:complete